MTGSYADTGEARCSALPARPVTVVICAYTEARWEQTQAAVGSVLSQSPAPEQVILVIDHNPELAERARGEAAGVTVLESEGLPGLSGARNTGLRKAGHPVTVFLDDDAEARQGWLTSLTEPYADPRVIATGGGIQPRWPRARPAWMPPTFDWVIGCSYAGQPEVPSAVRNPIGANMSFRTDAALEAGGFDSGVGRVGSRPSGCEETELAIRLTSRNPGSVVWYVPAAVVDHHVDPARLTLRYFLRRCWHEGRSKAYVVTLAGASAGLESERRHATAAIPAAALGDFRAASRGDFPAFARIGAMLAGISAAACGYLAGRSAITGRRRQDVH